MAQNAWNVLHTVDGRTVIKVFDGDTPKQSGALAFRNSLVSKGEHAEIYSRREAFPPPQKYASPPRSGLLWCPYCVKWREFEELVVVRPDYETPELMRCTVCLISIKDYYVRKYNPEMVARMAVEDEIKKSRTQRKAVEKKVRRRRR